MPNDDLSREEQIDIFKRAFSEAPERRFDDDGPDLQFIRDALPDYTVEEQIGAGGQGKVYLGFKNDNPRSVAIKVLLDGPFAGRRQRNRFAREIDMLSNLNHPGIIKVYDSGTVQGRPYLIMEFVHGLPITEHVQADGFDAEECIAIFLEACLPVSAAHAKGIVHRDLKPSNIMVDGNGKVRLLDFGLAKDMSSSAMGSSEISLTEGRVGTAKYSSPEQIRGRPAGVQSDVYSMGVVLFQMLSSVLPYENSEVRSDVERTLYSERLSLREAVEDNPIFTSVSPNDVSRNLEAVLDTALAKEPDLRYATVDEFAQDLRRYLDGQEVKAHSAVGHRIRARISMAYRRKLTAAALIAVIATLSSIAVIASYGARESRRETEEVARMAKLGMHISGYVRQATAKYNEREPDQAIAFLQQAVDLVEFMPNDHPLVRRQAYHAYHNLAEYYFETNRPEEARQHCEKATELAEALQKEHPNDLLWIRLGTYSRWLSGRLSFAEEDWQAAIEHFESVRAVRADLAEREPGVPHRKLELASAHTWIGKTARKGKQLDKAVRHDQAACTIFADLLASEPEMTEYTIRLMHAEVLLASDYMCYRTSDASELAMAIFARARQRVTKVNATMGQQNRIDDLLAAIGQNVETLNRRSTSTEPPNS